MADPLSEKAPPPSAPPGQPEIPGEPPAQPPPAYPGSYQAGTAQPGYVPPPGNYPPQQTSVTVVAQVWSEFPTAVKCRQCNNQITTVVTKEKGNMVWLLVGVLILFGCWCGCCLIPFCMPSCHDSIHSCPVCRTQLGRCKKL